jgi:hypothetical protein
MEQVTPSSSPYSSFVVVHQTGGTPSWVIPVITIVVFVLAQAVTIILFLSSRRKADRERFDMTFRGLAGKLSATGHTLQSIGVLAVYESERISSGDTAIELYATFAELELVAPDEQLRNGALRVAVAGRELAESLAGNNGEVQSLRRQHLGAVLEEWRDAVRDHLGQPKLQLGQPPSAE